MKNSHLRILNDIDSAGRGRKGRGRKSDEQERGTRRKDGRGERSDVEEGAMRTVKNEK